VRRGPKRLPVYNYEGWRIEKQPNSFASSHVYRCYLLDEAGYNRCPSLGCDTLKACMALIKQRNEEASQS
jgi:hypothetical protein